ncbi:Sec20-domain-containing protein [Xylaria sp. CBS 124048]|nr:Sec20-domain-containing protein [Xylaria sp. CBS 124048]
MSLDVLGKRFADLQERLNVLQDATGQLQELINRLANLDIQPGSVPLNVVDGADVGSELGSEINQILREQEEELELLQEEIVDIPTGKPGSALRHDKVRLKDGTERLQHELQLCRKSFRKAQITAKQNLQIAQRRERELLYASFANPRSAVSSPAPAPPGATATATATIPFPRRRQQHASEMSKEEQMISATHDVTQSMRRTHDMMAAELAKSDFAHNALKASTEALAQLSENYSSLDTMLSSSRALLGTLLKSQKTDTWYLQSAFYLLVVTVGWLIFRRLLWGPTWWLVWLPLKLLFRTLVGISGALGITGAVGLRGEQIASEAVSHSMSFSVQPSSSQSEAAVPTIQVSPSGAEPSAPAQENSTLEEVGRIIDESQNAGSENPGEENRGGETVLRERTAEEPRNPRKRMMEVPPPPPPPPPADEQKGKDEL